MIVEREVIRRINKLPCPICSSRQSDYRVEMNEGCTHPVPERLRAFVEIAEGKSVSTPKSDLFPMPERLA